MSKPKYGYGWILKWLLAALLLGVGIYMRFAEDVVFIVTGVAIVLFSFLRIVPLMKSLNKEILRTLNLIEIIFSLLIGGVLIYVAATQESLTGTWEYVYRYGLAFVFYARGLVFFNSTVFLGEKTEVPKFWGHILALSLGVAIAVIPNFGPKTVGIFFLLISIIGAVYLGYDGFGGYKIYREHAKELNAEKEKQKEQQKQKEAPILDVPQDEERPYVS